MAKKIDTVNEVPQTYEDLKEAIAARYSTLSRQLQQIARFVLENPDSSALDTVTIIADRADVQPSSMVRFAKSLGFDGFTNMQQVFRSRLIENSPSYRDRIKSLRQKSGNGGIDELLNEFVNEDIQSLEHLLETVPTENLGKAAMVLAEADEIYLLAQGRAFPVTFYLSYALGRLERRCHLMDGIGGLLRQQAQMATTKDAIIAVSFNPYSPSVVDIVTERNEKGIPIISITDSPLSPLAMESNVTFEISEIHERPFRSLVAPMCLAQSLVVALGHVVANNNGKS